MTENLNNDEIWKSLKGIVECGDYYEVSNMGRVRSIDRYTKNGRLSKGQILKQSLDDRYLKIYFSLNGKNKTYRVHRLIALAFIPNPNNLPEVNHKDGVKTNNNVDNLEWCTEKENVNHAVENGLTSQIGETHRNAMLEDNDVFKIVELWNTGSYTKKQISEIFNVTNTTVCNILNGVTWKHLNLNIINSKRNKQRNNPTIDDTILIRRLHIEKKYTLSQLSDMFNMSNSTINRILTGSGKWSDFGFENIKINNKKGKSLTQKEKDIVFDLYIIKKSHTHQQLADMFGVSRATIQRAIKEFDR